MSRPRSRRHHPAKSPESGRTLPGEPCGEAQVRRFIRVNQAGEFGAMQIYKGQLAVLGGRDSEPVIRRMAEQEQAHLETFDRLMVERRVRPTALTPLWRLAGFALGAGTALIGEKAAMACTVAVEEVIETHYDKQAQSLGDREPALRRSIEQFRNDEAHHRDVGLEHGAAEAPGYRLLTGGIKRGTRLAIWLSERI